jgi:hypothetical protein
MQQTATSSGSALKIVGIALLVAGGVLYAALGGPDDDPSGFLGVIVMIGGVLLHFRGRQHAAKLRAMRAQSAATDSKPDVLYLRSFTSDASTSVKVVQSGLTTEEEQLADVLRPFGDLVAIGQPGEPLPIPGATRVYAKDSEWKNVVLERMRSAPLVVIRAGTGPGLLWEFAQAVTELSPERLLIFVFNISVKDYATFADEVRASCGLNLPRIEGNSPLKAVIDYRESSSNAQRGFICFSRDWSAAFLPLPITVVRTGYNDFRKPFSLALRGVFERHGFAWRAAGRFGE